MTELAAALVCAVLCGVLGLLVPRLVAAVPEPEPAPEPRPEDEEPPPARTPYAELARLPGLAGGSAVAGVVVGAAIGAAVGWGGALLFLVPLVPVCTALFVIDAQVRLLPTWVIHRTYAALAVLLPLAALVDRDLDALVRAAGGWLVLSGFFWGSWLLTRGAALGFGDVRLTRVLGPALGFLGWYEVVAGLFLIVLVGGLVPLVALARGRLDRRYPYGPSLLVGALLAVVAGEPLARALGY